MRSKVLGIAFLVVAISFALSAFGQVSAVDSQKSEFHALSGDSSSKATVGQNVLASLRMNELAVADPDPAGSPIIATPIKPARVEKPRVNPRDKKVWISLMAFNHGAAAFDAWSTRSSVQRGNVELNPLLKPFANSNAMYVSNQIVPFGMDYLGYRMMRSQNRIVRKLWWLPQTASAACALAAGIHNMGVN